jgi:hypothetical protein
MHEMEVDREHGRGAAILGHDVAVPDLLDERARGGHGSRRLARDPV